MITICPNTTLPKLENDLRLYHSLIRQSRCDSIALEELIVNALKADPNNVEVVWDSGSHKSGPDIEVLQLPNKHKENISVKSGQVDAQGMLSISGSRLTKLVSANKRSTSDLQDLNSFLSGPQHKANWCFSSPCLQGINTFEYSIYNLPASIFQYPTQHTQWTLKHTKTGKNKGSIGGLTYTAPNDIRYEIRFTMSSQLWTFVPQSVYTPYFTAKIIA